MNGVMAVPAAFEIHRLDSNLSLNGTGVTSAPSWRAARNANGPTGPSQRERPLWWLPKATRSAGGRLLAQRRSL